MASRKRCFGRPLLLSARAVCLLSVLWPQWAAAQMMEAPFAAPPVSAGQDGGQSVAPNQAFFQAPPSAGGTTPFPPPSLVEEPWRWQFLPNGLMYPAYLAGIKESRLGSQLVRVKGHGWYGDFTLGGHVGMVRYGNDHPLLPEGWQLDVEAAAFPRLDFEADGQLHSSDFRVGIPLTFRRGIWEGKLSYYHLCAHLGDLFVIENPTFPRISYVRDCMTLGAAVRPWESFRFYCELDYAVREIGLSKPWQFQFGAEYSSIEPSGARGAPFVAVNSHLRQENDFSGNVCMQTGWQWRAETGHLMRVGLQYFNGMSEEYQTFSTFEEQVGVGLWYDFSVAVQE